jgi:hypothetical protein
MRKFSMHRLYYKFSISSKPFQIHGLIIWNEGIETGAFRDPFFKVTKIRIVGPGNLEVRL